MVKKKSSSLTNKTHLLWYTGAFLVLIFVLMSQEQVTVEEVEIINELGEVEAQDSNDLSGQAYRRRSRTYTACSDTDNGNINSKGKRKYSYKYGSRTYTRSNTDYCYNGRSRYYKGKLMEYSCNGKKPSFKAVTCPKGCSNGACISDSPSTSKQSTLSSGSKIWKKHKNYWGPPYCNQASRLGGPSLCSSPRRKTNLDGKDCSAYKTGQTVKTAYSTGYNFICTESKEKQSKDWYTKGKNSKNTGFWKQHRISTSTNTRWKGNSDEVFAKSLLADLGFYNSGPNRSAVTETLKETMKKIKSGPYVRGSDVWSFVKTKDGNYYLFFRKNLNKDNSIREIMWVARWQTDGGTQVHSQFDLPYATGINDKQIKEVKEEYKDYIAYHINIHKSITPN